VSFYGAFYEEGAISIALEYMDGSLADLIGVTAIPEPILCNITLQVWSNNKHSQPVTISLTISTVPDFGGIMLSA